MIAPLRVLVCGGRDFDDEELLFRELDRLDFEHPIGTIIEGGQRTRDRMGEIVGGADFFAFRWACLRARPGLRFDAN